MSLEQHSSITRCLCSQSSDRSLIDGYCTCGFKKPEADLHLFQYFMLGASMTIERLSNNHQFAGNDKIEVQAVTNLAQSDSHHQLGLNMNQSAGMQHAVSIQNITDGNMGSGTATCNILDENARIVTNSGYARPTLAPTRVDTRATFHTQLQARTQQFEEQEIGCVE